MDTLEVAYKILYSLEHRKKTDFMGKLISPQRLGCDEQKWLEVLESLSDEGFVKGAVIRENIMGETEVDVSDIKITLKGAQYLKENSAMAKFGKVVSNVITIGAETVVTTAAEILKK